MTKLRKPSSLESQGPNSTEAGDVRRVSQSLLVGRTAFGVRGMWFRLGPHSSQLYTFHKALTSLNLNFLIFKMRE